MAKLSTKAFYRAQQKEYIKSTLKSLGYDKRTAPLHVLQSVIVEAAHLIKG